MAANSDRVLFLEAIKTKAYTLNEIVETFSVSLPTARNWSKLPQVEKIEGSYPHAFRYRDSGTLPQVKPGGTKPPTEKPKGNYIELPKVPEKDLESFFHRVMDDTADPFQFNVEFRMVDSLKMLDEVERKLKSCFLLTQYYRELMVRDGVE